ncbi:MAG: NTP transferase domain-containing protein, partial [Gemmatimonadetes bacterium]|nr:NTP transferase domain-containing protein [Gemmatimonadota bacterium]
MPGTPALVILAAGIGSRYGGPKQLEQVGPGGATLMDYSIYDARRSGVRRVVFVVGPDLEAPFRILVRERYANRVDAAIAVQRLEDVPAGVTAAPPRRSPWGTGHAVLAAEPEIDRPFAVVNADDFYGRGAFAMVAEFLGHTNAPGPLAVFANVAYPLGQTLSLAGGVSRAICRVSRDGWLETVEEITDLRPRDDGAFAGVDPRGRPQRVGGDALVSMN